MAEMRKQWWVWAALTVVAVYALAAQIAQPRGNAITAFGNLVQSALLLVLLCVMVMNLITSHGRIRLFWLGMAVAASMWLCATMLWTWFEVVARRKVPDPFVGDVLFFIHLVPVMGALALRPHRPQEKHRLEFDGLDFLILLLWWVYLYLALVIPWQYVHPDRGQYGYSFDLLYAIENGILVAAFAIASIRTRNEWRQIYALFLCGASVYAVAAQTVNQAISRDRYYTGSIFDVPLVLSMVIFVLAGLFAYKRVPQPMPESESRITGLLASRLAMLAVISLPLLAMWAWFADSPPDVRYFRLIVTTGALLVLPVLIFLKQHLLDRELMRLWRESQHNYENLKRLQGQLVQAEKLAALTQLVAGAAHEINNPLTAIMGYSDLLADDPEVPSSKKNFIDKIGQQARRVREVVANLRSFAKQIPGDKAPLDVNPLLANAVELHAIDLEGSAIRIEQELATALPPVMGDETRLLQVWFHIISNAVDAIRQSGGKLLTVRSRAEGGKVIVEFLDDGPGIKDTKRIFDPFYTTKPIGMGTGLGLSACYGIVQDHQGQISCENLIGGGAKFTIVLPEFAPPEKAESAPGKARATAAAVTATSASRL